MIIYYSGQAKGFGLPEVLLGKKANIMLTYYDSHKKMQPRFKKIKKARKEARNAVG